MYQLLNKCEFKIEVLFSSDYGTVSKNMLHITLRRLIFAWIYFWQMLILSYLADFDTFIFADDDILIILRGSIVAINRVNNVYVFYNKRGGEGGAQQDGQISRSPNQTYNDVSTLGV